jgi:orotate phosphoribosyltransferase-like protein
MTYVADVAEAEQWLVDWRTRITDSADRAREMATRMSGLTVTSERQNGAVRVTVDSNGVPVDIALGCTIEGWSANRVGAEIMATMRQAQSKLTRRLEEVAADTVGAGSEMAQTMLTPYLKRFAANSTDKSNDG